MTSDVVGQGTAADPWVLKTPPGTSDYSMHKDEASDPPAPGVHGGHDHAVLPVALPPGPSRDAARAWRLDGAGLGRRAEDGQGRHRRSMGSIREQPDRRLVRPEEGAPRAVRYVHPSADGGTRSSGAGAQPTQQPDARHLRAVVLEAGLFDLARDDAGSWWSSGRPQDVEVALTGVPQRIGDRLKLARAEPAFLVGSSGEFQGPPTHSELGLQPGRYFFGRRFWEAQQLRSSVAKRLQRVDFMVAGLIPDAVLVPDKQWAQNAVVPQRPPRRTPCRRHRLL